MKNFYLAALLVSMCFSASAQLSRGRIDERVISGVKEHVLDGPRFNFTLYRPGSGEQFALTATHNVVAFRSDNQLTNVFVLLPNPSNSLRRAYRLMGNGNVTLTLSNTFGTTFNTATNVVTKSVWVTDSTNQAVWVYNNGGTNWFVDPD